MFPGRQSMAKAKRPRTERRELEREQRKLSREREKLFALEPGGSPDRPREVGSASLVEPEAKSTRCPRCGGEHRLEEHVATTLDGVRLRETKLVCRQCGARRSLWFKITTLEPN